MEREKESFKVWTDDSRRIVYSKGQGTAHAHEIEWLYRNIVDLAKDWNDEKGYAYMAFIEELKQQVTEIVNEVMTDSTNRRVTVLTDAELKKVKSPKAEAAPKPKAARKSKAAAPKEQTQSVKEGDVCPLCGQGHIIKGKTAYGCSRWKEGCTFRAPIDER